MSNDGTIALQSKKMLRGSITFEAFALAKARDVDFYLNDHLLTHSTIQTNGTQFKFPATLNSGNTTLRVLNLQEADIADFYARNGDHRLLSIRIRDLRFVFN